MTVAKGLDVRDFTLTTFGGSGLAAGLPADGHPQPAAHPRAAEPGQRQRVRAAHRRRPQRLRADRRLQARRPRPRPACGRSSPTWRARPQAALDGEGFGRDEQRMQRTADLRYVGQAFEVRVPVPDGAARRRRRGGRSPRPSTPPTASSTATTSPTDPRQAVEWVNLRVSGIGPIRRPDMVELPAEGRRDGPGRHGLPPGLLRRLGRDAHVRPARPRARRRRDRPGDHRGVRLDRPGPPRLRRHRRRLRQPAAHEGVGPMTPTATARSTPTRSSSRSSPARWRRSRRRSRPRSGARRARR